MPLIPRRTRFLRRSRVMRGSWGVWKPRIVFWLGAVAIGVVSVGFAKAADLAQHLFHHLLGSHTSGYLIPLLLTPAGFASNHAGGILGGISSGQDIIAHATLKPTSSIQVPGKTIDLGGNPVDVVTTGRHDPCVGLRATPIAEAMLAIVLLDHYLRHRAQNADVRSSTPAI